MGLPGRRPRPTRKDPIPRRAGVQRPVLGRRTTRPTWPRRRCRSCSAGPPPPVRPAVQHHHRGSTGIIGIKLAEIAKAIFGLTLPINTANDFVLAPVSQLIAPYSPVAAAAVARYKAAGGDLSPGAPAPQVASSQQAAWLNNYAKALARPSAKFTPTSVTVPPGNYGPVPVIITAELLIAHNGSLDGYFQSSQQQLSTNTTIGTMFFSDGTPVGQHRRRPRASAATNGAS